ncbi:MAG: tetratricopeptide repeat protein [Acidobacteriota bacterium]
MADSTRQSVATSAVIGWILLTVLLVAVVGFGLTVAGVVEIGASDADTDARIAADLDRAAKLLGLDREDLMVGDLGVDPERLEEAGHLVDRAVARAPRSADAHRLRAIHRLMAGDLDTASNAATRAVAFEPAEPMHHLLLGAIQAQKRDFVAAEATFRRATETWPGSVEAWHGLGQTLFLLGREDDAAAAYREKLAVQKRRDESTER